MRGAPDVHAEWARQAPGLPAIPATGKFRENDEERFCLKLNQGKIVSCHVIALGTYTGFAGFYEQIGGSLVHL